MSVAANLDQIRRQVSEACTRCRRSPSDVALMAVSKVHPVSLLLEAYAAGQRLFGENKVQEWQQKAPATAHLDDLDMHLIGPLQSNKTGRAAELFHAIDTVDSIRLAQRLNEGAVRLHKRIPVLVEIKLSTEESKHGLPPAQLEEFLDAISSFENINPVGLMTIPPWPSELRNAGEEARPYFRTLRLLRDQVSIAHPTVTGLSMGMSNDFVSAIEEGSTCVRIGTAIFGKRVVPVSL